MSYSKELQDRLQEVFGLFADNGNHAKKAPSKYHIYFIGIKGTGMCALAQLLHHWGYKVSGSDTAEHFYTDDLLLADGILYYNGFAPW